MSTAKPVVVYGVSGYTGRLICEYLREYNVPFVAAGRDKDRIQDVVDRIPGVDDVLHDVVQVEHSVGAHLYPPLAPRQSCGSMPPIEAWKPKARCFVPTIERTPGDGSAQRRVMVGSAVATKNRSAPPDRKIFWTKVAASLEMRPVRISSNRGARAAAPGRSTRIAM